jgi:hypothetical protein
MSSGREGYERLLDSAGENSNLPRALQTLRPIGPIENSRVSSV